MRIIAVLGICLAVASSHASANQEALLQHARSGRRVSPKLFAELEELARLADIAYCVGATSLGIIKPFKCLSRCSDFSDVELVTEWSTGVLLSDSSGYIALDHGKQRVVVAFRGTQSISNTIVDLSTVPQEYVPYPGSDGDEPSSGLVSEKAMNSAGSTAKRELEKTKPKCHNCTVHMGFHTAWLHTRDKIFEDLQKQMFVYPHYDLVLTGHSLGGAIAGLAGLDLQARGWDPTVTTFGEPRIGNEGLVKYLDARFNLTDSLHPGVDDTRMKYRRVTHIDDPVPLLPLSEWSYAMHAGEIHISKPDLSPDIEDLQHCEGDYDQRCIAGQDSTTPGDSSSASIQRRDLLESVKDEIHDVINEPWGIPSRYKLWQLLFAHRDYFWRLGLCVPGGDPLGGGKKYEDSIKEDLR